MQLTFDVSLHCTEEQLHVQSGSRLRVAQTSAAPGGQVIGSGDGVPVGVLVGVLVGSTMRELDSATLETLVGSTLEIEAVTAYIY